MARWVVVVVSGESLDVEVFDKFSQAMEVKDDLELEGKKVIVMPEDNFKQLCEKAGL